MEKRFVVYFSHKTSTIRDDFEKLVSELKLSNNGTIEVLHESLEKRITEKSNAIENLRRISDPQNAVILIEFPETLHSIATLYELMENLIELYNEGSYVLLVTQSQQVLTILNIALMRYYRTNGLHPGSIDPEDLKVYMEDETNVTELEIDPDTGEIPSEYWDSVILVDVEPSFF